MVCALAPTFHLVDHHGAGDSMTAGITAALARGADMIKALRLGAASGSLNTTRPGLATGERDPQLGRHRRVGLDHDDAGPQRDQRGGQLSGSGAEIEHSRGRVRA
nr:PfkB family carbohydrate kinase [Pseudofrankia sp. DC12]